MALIKSYLCIPLWLSFVVLQSGEARIASSFLPDGMQEDEADAFKDPMYKRQGQGIGKDEDSNGKYVGDFNSDCAESVFVTPTAEATIAPDDSLLSEAGVKCHWNVIGTEKCTPLLECSKFKLAASPDCGDEYLEITDGVNGYKKVCGGDTPTKLTSTNGLRDLYLTYQAGGGSEKRKLKCTVSCSLKKDCGRKPNADRIVGGEDAKKSEFPWIAALVTAKTRRPFCGGTVINNKFILTAAHCFKGPYMKKENMQILLNGHFMDLTSSKVAAGQGDDAGIDYAAAQAADKKEGAVRFSVEKYFLHPLYVRQTNDYDVALIKLTEPIDFSKYTSISPACMDKPNSHETMYDGLPGVVAGWGLNSSDAGHTMGTLQKLNVKVFTTKECQGFFDQRFTRRMMCAGYKEAGKDSCKGDSGGPLISEMKKQVWSLIGSVSWGEGCAKGNSPGVYSRLPEVLQWVHYMTNNEDSTWCHE